MLALYRPGRQADALEVYQDARHALVDELGIEPGARAAASSSRRSCARTRRSTCRSQARAPAPARVRRRFVGRERRSSPSCVPLLDGALSGRGGFVLIGGEPGIGKSRLAEELAGQAQERGARVLVGRCWEAGGAPAYWPWVQALRAYVARRATRSALRSHVAQAGAELAHARSRASGQLLPTCRRRRDSDSEGARFRLFESVAGSSSSAAASQPLALFFDDLHAADAPSLLLLRFVAAELARAPILIVGCYRDTEVGPGQPLAEALPELAREAARPAVSLGDSVPTTPGS